MAAAVAIGLAKMCSHWEKTRLEAMPGLMILANDRPRRQAPALHCPVHDGIRQTEISEGLAEYQCPVVRVVNVLDRGHKQKAGFARAGRATVEQVRAFLVGVEPEPLLI